MAKRTVRVDVKIASPTVSKFGEPDKAAQEIVDRMFSVSLKRIQARTEVSLRGLEKTLQVAAEREYMNAMRFITKEMMGRLSPDSSKVNFRITGEGSSTQRNRISSPSARINIPIPSGNSFGSPIVWDPLAQRTLEAKLPVSGSRDKARRFFIHTGTLKKSLVRRARTLVRKTGLVSVRIKKTSATGTTYLRKVDRRTGKVPLADLVIRIAPKIPASALSGISSADPNTPVGMEFERRLGITNPDLLAKLSGTTKHRPMFQPVFSYWTLFHVPNAVANRLADVLYRDVTRSGEGISEGI